MSNILIKEMLHISKMLKLVSPSISIMYYRVCEGVTPLIVACKIILLFSYSNGVKQGCAGKKKQWERKCLCVC